jgi:phosphoribosylaminoimidazole-succinocarboxamide synthase
MIVTETALPLPLHARGKVRDVYRVGENLLIVATDRISAFDYVLATGIPDKGRVLTQLSIFWFGFVRDLVATHFITENVDDYPEELRPYRAILEGRSMLVRHARMVDVECVARGYLAGSGWKEYRNRGTICGIALPLGLRESDRLPEPLFTPATKAQTGHDENISFEQMAELTGREVAEQLRSLTLAIYTKAADYALSRGVVLADTKFEFGYVGRELLLADEVMTPDSSRFWPADLYEPGRPQFSYDKQYVRDYLEEIGWDKRPPAPALPAEVVASTSQKYREAYQALTGRVL